MTQMSKGFREKTISVTEHGFEVHENILEGDHIRSSLALKL